MITKEQYFGAKVHTPEHEAAFDSVNDRRQRLRDEYYLSTGREPDIDPDTGTEISGKKGGSGDGGFREQTTATGATDSPHKGARAIDDSDQKDEFDAWLDQFEVPMPNGQPGGNTKLEEYGLYREHPSKTPTWVHLTDRAPGSGKRTFMP
jgi:hypothetical protein